MLHYAPDPDAAAKLPGLFGAPVGEHGGNVFQLRRIGGAYGEPR
jgi:hypothetical protein